MVRTASRPNSAAHPAEQDPRYDDTQLGEPGPRHRDIRRASGRRSVSSDRPSGGLQDLVVTSARGKARVEFGVTPLRLRDRVTLIPGVEPLANAPPKSLGQLNSLCQREGHRSIDQVLVSHVRIVFDALGRINVNSRSPPLND